jgi:hypothetical protein
MDFRKSLNTGKWLFGRKIFRVPGMNSDGRFRALVITSTLCHRSSCKNIHFFFCPPSMVPDFIIFDPYFFLLLTSLSP